MSKSIFISAVYEDRQRIEEIKKWAAEKRLGDVAITYELEDKRPLGAEAIKLQIKSKIEGAAIVLVLIGQDTHNHEWIKAEVELANSSNKKIVCMRIPNTTGAVPPILNNYQLLPFEPSTLKKVLG